MVGLNMQHRLCSVEFEIRCPDATLCKWQFFKILFVQISWFGSHRLVCQRKRWGTSRESFFVDGMSVFCNDLDSTDLVLFGVVLLRSRIDAIFFVDFGYSLFIFVGHNCRHLTRLSFVSHMHVIQIIGGNPVWFLWTVAQLRENLWHS